MPVCLAVAILASAGCTKERNAFTVDDPQGVVARADLHLCSSSVQLARHDKRFSGDQPADCEGDGEVLLHLSNGRTISCPIGYVTGDLGQRFDFVVKNGECRP
jgi:hypothetical protein